MTPSERAALGAALLDRNNPNWILDVRVRFLDMGEMDSCLLGQVYGCYHQGLSRLSLDGMGARRHGFLGKDRADDRLLAMAWASEIGRRVTTNHWFSWLF